MENGKNIFFTLKLGNFNYRNYKITEITKLQKYNFDFHSKLQAEEFATPYMTDEEVSSEEDENSENKAEKKVNKRGRKCSWPEDTVTDLVDIILESEKYKSKLLLTNTKNVKNGIYYGEVIDEMKKRSAARNEVFLYNVAQTRSKFKRCVSMCRKAALTIKTSSGIKRFQEEKEFGPWFERLYQIVCTMANCQPEQSIEPHVSRLTNLDEDDLDQLDTNIDTVEQEREGIQDHHEDRENGSKTTKKKRQVFVPEIKSANKKKKQSLENTLDTMSKTLETLSSAIKEDSQTKELVQFLKEDAERQERRDNAFMTMMQSFMMGQVPQSSTPNFAHRPFFSQGTKCLSQSTQLCQSTTSTSTIYDV